MSDAPNAEAAPKPRWVLPPGTHSVAAGGREFRPDADGFVDLSDLDSTIRQHVIELAGVKPAPSQEQMDLDRAAAEELARHTKAVEEASAAAALASQAAEEARARAEEEKRVADAAAAEEKMAQRAQEAADVAEQDRVVVTPPEPAIVAPAAPIEKPAAGGVVPPSRVGTRKK